MTAIEKRATLVELEDADAARNLELAAARVEVRATYLLRQAFDCSGMSQKQLAERIGVTDGRVSQVLNSDGNLKITTIARFLRALGYRLELDANPAAPGVASLKPVRSPRKSSKDRDEVFLGVNDDTGAPTTMLIRFKPDTHSKNFSGLFNVGTISQATTAAVSRTVLSDLTLVGHSEGVIQSPEVDQ